MTTDQDLIKDGVQAIDDKFLEWFVNNPSWKKVEVKREKIRVDENFNDISHWNRFVHKIIIPKEEPKQDYTSKHIEHCHNIAMESLVKEPKQETLKQTAVEWLEDKIQSDMTFMEVLGLIRQAKEMEAKQKSYTKKDMKRAFDVGFQVGYNDEESPSYLTFDEWIVDYEKKV